jgi:hypothetical protein
MTEIEAAVWAYMSSALTMVGLWLLALRNRSSGWKRQRHPNCFMPIDNSEAPGESPSPLSRPAGRAAAGARQFVRLIT